MAEGQFTAGTPNVALITVGLEHELAEEVAYAAGAMPWNVYRADLESYVSPVRRPPLPQSVKLAHHCIAVIDFDRDLDQALETIAYIQELFSGKAALIARSTSRDADILLRSMRAGCNDFIGGAFDAAAFDETLKRIAAQWTMRATSNAARGSVLTFLGAKGGVGTTTLAVHFAFYLAQCHKKKVLLIDNHPQLGHACVYLGIDGSSYYFHELVRNLNRLTVNCCVAISPAIPVVWMCSPRPIWSVPERLWRLRTWPRLSTSCAASMTTLSWTAPVL